MSTSTPHLTGRDSRSASILSSTRDYASAQALVDRMSEAGFPVEHVRIIGRDLTTVEQVTGRFAKGKATWYGAGSGAMIGLFAGMLFGIFTIGPWFSIAVTSVIIGAVWGAVFGFLGHLATGGLRDFRSVKSLTAQRYDVEVDASHAAEAVRFADHTL